jgi:hypothetical protein
MKSNRFFEGQPLGPNELRRVVQTERAAIMFPCNPFVSQWNITTPQNLNCITFAHFQSLKPLQTSFSVLLLQNDEGPAIFIEHERHFWRVIDSLRYYDPGPDKRPLWNSEIDENQCLQVPVPVCVEFRIFIKVEISVSLYIEVSSLVLSSESLAEHLKRRAAVLAERVELELSVAGTEYAPLERAIFKATKNNTKIPKEKHVIGEKSICTHLYDKVIFCIQKLCTELSAMATLVKLS